MKPIKNHQPFNFQPLTIRKLEARLEDFPLDDRMAYTLKELNGMDDNEIADCLNLNKSELIQKINRVKIELKKEIKTDEAFPELYSFHLKRCDCMVEKVMTEIEDLI